VVLPLLHVVGFPRNPICDLADETSTFPWCLHIYCAYAPALAAPRMAGGEALLTNQLVTPSPMAALLAPAVLIC